MLSAPRFRIGLKVGGPAGEIIEITEFIDEGGFGEVYKGVDISSGHLVAIKFFHPNSWAHTALFNEIEVTTQISHPNVVKVLHTDKGSDPNIGPYLIMEYLGKGTLRSILKSQAKAGTHIPLAQARSMMLDVARGTKAINEKLIHRDIKPDNILLGDSGLKISDFGISRIIGEQTRTHTFKGYQHAYYMAPEGWENQTNTPKIDIYSVGLVFYEILTLQHPLRNKVKNINDRKEWERAHRFIYCPDVKTLRSDVSLPLAQLLEKMVSKRAEERPDWDEVIMKLELEDYDLSLNTGAIIGIVEAARQKHLIAKQAELAQREIAEREEVRLASYQYSVESLNKIFNLVVDEFNSKSQHGKISIVDSDSGRTFVVPSGHLIRLVVFSAPEQPIRIGAKYLLGGGHIGIQDGFGANLVLLGQHDDSYGEWSAVSFDLNSSRNVQSIKRRLSIKWIPFGFEDAMKFYEDAPFALRPGVHEIQVHEIMPDLRQFFISVLKMVI